MHEPIEVMTKAQLGARIDTLLLWPHNPVDALDRDPRCDHDPECAFNDVIELERLLCR